MELNRMLRWIVVAVCVLSEIAVTVSGAYCPYLSAHGKREVRDCPGRCCSESGASDGPVCCEFDYPNGAYVGAGVGTIIVIGVIILCSLYICCKQRIIATYRRNANTRTCTRTRSPSTHGENIPSVSGSIDPIMPPPYDSLPPPYYTNQIEMGENSDDTKDKNKKYPDYPPPVYTEYTETTSDYTETATEHTETAIGHTETVTEHTETAAERTEYAR